MLVSQTYICRSIFLDSLYLRSKRLKILILLIQVTFSGIRALAVPFLLPTKQEKEVNLISFLSTLDTLVFLQKPQKYPINTIALLSASVPLLRKTDPSI